jgi:transposase
MAGTDAPLQINAAERRELQKDKRQVRKLEKELKRKDRALAEAAALLLLQKKAQAIWGDAEDD